MPDLDFPTINFGGKDPKHDYASLSNVLFLNGEKDPWYEMCVNFKVGDATVINNPDG